MEDDTNSSRSSVSSTNSEKNSSLCSGDWDCVWRRYPVHRNMREKTSSGRSRSHSDRTSGPGRQSTTTQLSGPERSQSSERTNDSWRKKTDTGRERSQPGRPDRHRSPTPRQEASSSTVRHWSGTSSRSDRSSTSRRSKSHSPGEHQSRGTSRKESASPTQRQQRRHTPWKSTKSTSPRASRGSSDDSSMPWSRRKYTTVQVELGHRAGQLETCEERPIRHAPLPPPTL